MKKKTSLDFIKIIGARQHNLKNINLQIPKNKFVVISGLSGSGKSSLLESIAWTVWGQGRTSSDEDVIHASADYVRTDFVFICYQEVYRIIRSRQRNRTNSLDFQIKSSEGFTPLSRKGVKATQESIISTLKLDYETFINSCLLYTSPSPRDRG